jgi:transposase
MEKKTTYGKKRALWTEGNLAQAMAAVQRGMSQRDASITFNIPRRTIRNHLKSGNTKRCLGRKSILTVEQEQDLVRRIIRFSEVGIPITLAMLGLQFCVKITLPRHLTQKTAVLGKTG